MKDETLLFSNKIEIEMKITLLTEVCRCWNILTLFWYLEKWSDMQIQNPFFVFSEPVNSKILDSQGESAVQLAFE